MNTEEAARNGSGGLRERLAVANERVVTLLQIGSVNVTTPQHETQGRFNSIAPIDLGGLFEIWDGQGESSPGKTL